MTVHVPGSLTPLPEQLLATDRILGPDDFVAGRAENLAADVVVVGTGAGGSAVFRELALAGVDVLAVEAGEFHLPHRDFNQREEAMMHRLFWDNGARTDKDLTVTISHGKGVGGSTVHNICLSEQTPDAILDRWHQSFGVSGWSPQRLAPVFDRVRTNLRIAPISAGAVNRNNALLRQGTEALGWSGRIYDHNRFACLQCGYCFLGCAYNRKQSALITYVPSAIQAGGRLAWGLEVSRVNHRNGRTVGIAGTWTDPTRGRRLGPVTIKANHVVLAASAMMTPVLLLRSGITDTSGLTGQTLRVHPAAPVAGVFPEPVDGWSGLPQSYIVNEFADFYDDGIGGHVIIPLFGHPGLTGAMMPGVGPGLHSWMSNYRHIAAATPMVHDESKGRIWENRGRLRFEYQLNKRDQQELARGLRNTAEIFLAAGASQVLLPFSRRPIVARTSSDLDQIDRIGVGGDNVLLSSVHPQGSVPMAADPANGVVDSRGHHFGLQNLWVADGSLFPTSVGVPPQMSIYAAGTVVARELLRSKT